LLLHPLNTSTSHEKILPIPIYPSSFLEFQRSKLH
jgi:hypothetical protein